MLGWRLVDDIRAEVDNAASGDLTFTGVNVVQRHHRQNRQAQDNQKYDSDFHFVSFAAAASTRSIVSLSTSAKMSFA